MATPRFSAFDGAQRVIPLLNREIEDAYQTLLETKNLYQKVTIDWDKVISGMLPQVIGAYHAEFSQHVAPVPKMPFVPVMQLQVVNPQGTSGELGRIPLVLFLKNVVMFCRVCDRREAFRPLLYKDLTTELRQLSSSGIAPNLKMPSGFQDFIVVYQCQRCEGTPETLLIRRDGWGLSLAGRSPMASVEVPNFIPKKEAEFLRDAVIANGSGRTLAGLFYLRTFIEQFGRRVTGISGKATGSEILSEYAKTLPSHLRDSMPSLAEWYDKLSAAIHAANPDEGLFKEAQVKIEKHFEIRKAMSIPEHSVQQQEPVA